MQIIQTRRRFLAGAALAGAAGLVGAPGSLLAEPPPETATVRLPKIPAACVAPLYLARELLRDEGFDDVRYVPAEFVSVGMVATGEADFSFEAALDFLLPMDAGEPLTVVAGLQSGCFELIADDSIRGVPDLKGKSVGVSAIGASDHVLVSMMAAYVGLDPAADIDWVTDPSVPQADLFRAGKINAFLGFPPDPQQPCARNLGHVVVNTSHDRPWSQYFCCMLTANAAFVRDNPVATKRALRAFLRAADLCHERPEWAAQRMVEEGFSYECALQTLNDVRYDLWRDYDPEDTIRFFALRMHELGMIKATPNDIISRFTDWRFLDELKRELKT
jgi:NitT/TauT family transport system substrate-binding protein